MLTLLHFQSHGHRLQLRHPLSQLLDGHTQLQGSNGTGNGIVDRSLIDERNLVRALYTFIYILHLGGEMGVCDTLHIQRCFLVLTRPSKTFPFIAAAPHATTHHGVVRTIHHRLGIMEQLQFLCTFLVERAEVLLMRTTQTSEHTDGWLDHVVQGQHLPRLTDTRFEETHTRLLVQQPHRQGNAYL